MDQIDQLINILFDETADFAEKDDAAMDLGFYNDDRALKALELFSSNPNVDGLLMELLMASCGESIAQTWVSRDQFEPEVYKKLNPNARHEIQGYLKNLKPSWFKELESGSNKKICSMNNFTKDVGLQLKNELDKGNDVLRISNWAHDLFLFSRKEFSKDVNDILQYIFLMEAGPEFENTENELRFVAKMLINEEENLLQKINDMKSKEKNLDEYF